jgi:hypothetical protein
MTQIGSRLPRHPVSALGLVFHDISSPVCFEHRYVGSVSLPARSIHFMIADEIYSIALAIFWERRISSEHTYLPVLHSCSLSLLPLS